ncbi:mCG148222 [Mus musculus]|nr:mCG148222 [Mus musculus]
MAHILKHRHKAERANLKFSKSAPSGMFLQIRQLLNLPPDSATNWELSLQTFKAMRAGHFSFMARKR